MPNPLVLHRKCLAIRLIENQRAVALVRGRPGLSGLLGSRGQLGLGRSLGRDRRRDGNAGFPPFPEAGPAPLSLIVRARTDQIGPFSSAEIRAHRRLGWGEGKKTREFDPASAAGRGARHA